MMPGVCQLELSIRLDIVSQIAGRPVGKNQFHLPDPIVTVYHDGSNVMRRSDQSCPLIQVVKFGMNGEWRSFRAGRVDMVMACRTGLQQCMCR